MKRSSPAFFTTSTELEATIQRCHEAAANYTGEILITPEMMFDILRNSCRQVGLSEEKIEQIIINIKDEVAVQESKRIKL